jgi:hypothetical protein
LDALRQLLPKQPLLMMLETGAASKWDAGCDVSIGGLIKIKIWGTPD